MSGVFDWLAVGDLGLEDTGTNGDQILGGAAARLALHGAALGARVALVGKVGDDDGGERALAILRRSGIDLRWVRVATGLRTTVYHEAAGRPPAWRVDRGADAALRLDELPSASVAPARLTVISAYGLSVEPSRSAALGALASARARQGRAALFLHAELLWQTNARMTRRMLEPAIASVSSVALSERDVAMLFGSASEPRESLRRIADLGPRLVYLAGEGGTVWLRDGARAYAYPTPGGHEARDRYAGPAAFWVEVSRGTPARRAAAAAVSYAQGVRRAGVASILKS